MKNFLIPAAVLGIVAIALIFFFTNQLNNAMTTAPVPSMTVSESSPSADTVVTTMYQDGTYTVTGNYVSPGGPREIGVTVVLANGVITDTTFEGRATDATSKRFQGEFGDNFKSLVVGKNIDEVNLTKVSGSSLTPKGFNDAIEKIKVEAQS